VRLPDLRPGERVRDLEGLCGAERTLIGYWISRGQARPAQSPSSWMTARHGVGFWGPKARLRIAEQLPHIRHWRIIHGSAFEAPDVRATWFIDPPYHVAGRHYRFGSSTLDYPELGRWCARRRGLVIVTENLGADWLPFEYFGRVQANNSRPNLRPSHEVVWIHRNPA
jgi:hypothetical protein